MSWPAAVDETVTEISDCKGDNEMILTSGSYEAVIPGALFVISSARPAPILSVALVAAVVVKEYVPVPIYIYNRFHLHSRD